MKISIVGTTTFPCPPVAYGGEVCIFDLAMGLHELGHEIILYGVKNNDIDYPFQVNQLRNTAGVADYIAENDVLRYYSDDLQSSDIIHDISHSKNVSRYINNITRETNTVVTLLGHVWYGNQLNNVVVNSYRQLQLGILGGDLNGNIPQYTTDKIKETSKVVHLGTNTDFYEPKYDKEDYYLWFNRFHPWKGIEQVISLAKELKFKLVLAGSAELPDHRIHRDHYIKQIEGYPNITYVELPVDETHQSLKRTLLQNARALITPLQYEECFGLINIEALSCGTPIISNAIGALPEIIKHGKTGFLCKNYEEMKNYIKVIDEINPKDCHEDAVKRFDRILMARNYEKVYDDILDGEIF